MRFLVDANLPSALAHWISEQGDHAEHVSDVGLASADDRDIWAYAQTHNAVIVSKDEDFILLRATNALGPQIVWVRTGNATRRILLPLFTSAWPALRKALEQGQRIIELR